MVGLYFFTLKLLLIIDIMCVAPTLRILSALCWFEHLILIKLCLIDIFLMIELLYSLSQCVMHKYC